MSTKKQCCKCDKGSGILTCDGWHQTFCLKHVTEHRQELAQEMKKIEQRQAGVKRDWSERNDLAMLVAKVDRWEKEMIAKISNHARGMRADLKRFNEESNERLASLMEKLSNELRLNQENEEYLEDDLDRWRKQLDELGKEFHRLTTRELIEENSSAFRLLKIRNSDPSSEIIDESALSDILSPDVHTAIERPRSYHQSAAYPCVSFGLGQSIPLPIESLFDRLMRLSPMNKNEVMNHRCSLEVDQMERFLAQIFGLKTFPGENILPDVHAFELTRSPRSIDAKTMIYFPNLHPNSFAVTAEEIGKWQRSFKVYADQNVKGMTKEFLYHALQGKSRDGEGAFRMKFMVRISTCPIMMESNMKVIGRKLDDAWPSRIKLVSASGISFAGRKRDIGDILYYISNWKDVFDMDPKTGLPLVY